ncbi:MAG: B12-binding domain-containing radical SAM protein [Candidatus Omnitrophica bacterium]|nr:B12-binding domain-containing radical SAM protein [Candidatus Omnitrophota bacterium]
MKVYLINPPSSNGIKMVREGRCMQRKGAWTTVWPPITLATMAAMLLKEGIEARLNDCIVEDIDYKKLKLKIAEFKPDLVVITTATASINSDLYCAGIAKELSSGIKTLAFGLHPTVLPDESFLLEPSLDFVIRGEPEFCLLELVRALKQGGGFAQIKGLSYRDDSKIEHNPNRGFNDDLNELPFPAWELVDIRNYPLPLSGEPFLLVTTSKGCPHSCVFCPAKPYYGSRIRFRDVKLVVDEICYIKEKLGVSQFLIWSESFTEDKGYVMKLCDEIARRNLKISWACNSRVDKVDLEILRAIKKAGCWMIGFGVESGAQEILDNVNKGTTIKQIEDAIDWSSSAGLEVTAHVIFGLPGETLATGLKTIKWLNKLKIDYAQIYCAVPWPSTPLYPIAKEKGWLTTGDWQLYEQNHYILDMGTITKDEVEYLRRLAMRKFYLSPARIFKVLKKINSFKRFRLFIKMVAEFINWL